MIIWFVLAAVVALLDWWSVATDRRRVESIAKPAVMVALIAAAITLDADPTSAKWWVVGGLTFGLIGDVCLLPHVDRFIEGLGSFLVGHLLYTVALFGLYDGVGLLAVGVAVTVALMAVMAVPVLRAVRGNALQAPVTAYMGVTAVIVTLGVATGRWPLALGALAFAVSDGLLGADRFVAPKPNGRVAVHILYHLGQAGLVVGLAEQFA